MSSQPPPPPPNVSADAETQDFDGFDVSTACSSGNHTLLRSDTFDLSTLRQGKSIAPAGSAVSQEAQKQYAAQP